MIYKIFNLVSSKSAFIIILTIFTLPATFLSCKESKKEVNPFFNSAREYKHDRYSSEQECRKINSGLSVNCSETIFFDTNGEVRALLNGSDIFIKGNYRKNNNKIEVSLQDGPVTILELTFLIESETELLRTNNNTKWQAI